MDTTVDKTEAVVEGRVPFVTLVPDETWQENKRITIMRHLDIASKFQLDCDEKVTARRMNETCLRRVLYDQK